MSVRFAVAMGERRTPLSGVLLAAVAIIAAASPVNAQLATDLPPGTRVRIQQRYDTHSSTFRLLAATADSLHLLDRDDTLRLARAKVAKIWVSRGRQSTADAVASGFLKGALTGAVFGAGIAAAALLLQKRECAGSGDCAPVFVPYHVVIGIPVVGGGTVGALLGGLFRGENWSRVR